jgi:protein ImuB
MVSVWMPLFPIERLKRESGGEWLPDDRPFALVGSGERGLVLTAVNPAAAREGLYPDLGLADARAIAPHLLTLPADPEADRCCLVALARCAGRYSPSVNVDGEDGLWLDITGIPHLFGGEHALLADMAIRLRRLGFQARLGLAESLGGAHALARFARSSPAIVPPGQIRGALAPLPVEALRLEEDTVRLLKRLGLKRIGDLYALPRASLERRFHSAEEAEAVLKRLDQALGRREEPRKPLVPPSEFSARLPFPEPLITHEGIVAALDRLAFELCAALAVAGRGARRLRLAVYRADGTSALIEAGLSAPTRAPSHLLRLLQDKVGGIDAGFGVDLMVLAATATEPLSLTQESFAKSETLERQEPLIDRLANRLSPEAVRRLFAKDSHLPERAQETHSAFSGAQPWPIHRAPKPPRPPLLLAAPEPLEVIAEVPEGPPIRFTWRRVSRRVIKAEGPERIAPEWWLPLMDSGVAKGIPPLDGEGGEADGRAGWGDSGSTAPPPVAFGDSLPTKGRDHSSGVTPRFSATARTRDYYRIEDEEGRRYWVFREGLYEDGAGMLPAWYLHGVFG